NKAMIDIRAVVGLMVLAIVAACSGVQSQSTAFPTPGTNVSTAVATSIRVTSTGGGGKVDAAQIDAAEREWVATSIRSYTITVQDASFRHVQTNTITVENGSIFSQSATCMDAPAEPPPCKVDPFTAADYTVPGLFAWARSS